jgi:hypothetical protein
MTRRVPLPMVVLAQQDVDGVMSVPLLRVLGIAGVGIAEPLFDSIEAARRWADENTPQSSAVPLTAAPLAARLRLTIDNARGVPVYAVLNPPRELAGREAWAIGPDEVMAYIDEIMEDPQAPLERLAEPALLLGDHPSPVLAGEGVSR